MTRQSILTLAIVITIVFGSSTVRAIPQYLLTDLGAMDADNSYAAHINNNGLITGTLEYEDEYEDVFYTRSFLYEDGSMTLFGSADFRININDYGLHYGEV